MDKRAFVEILRQHRDRVFSYSLYCLRDRDDAEDVTQDAFLRLWHKRRSVDPERVEAWLIRVASNLCIDRARRRQTVRRALSSAEARDATAQAMAAAPAAPDSGLEREQARTRLLDAMNVLSAETRSAMVMHYFQGLKIEEVARVLGRNTSTVKVQLFRARRAMRQVLAAERDAKAALQQETTG